MMRGADHDGFDALLVDPLRYTAFLDFLARHDAAPLLMFHMEVEQFRRLVGSDAALRSHGTQIARKYLARDAPQVLLSEGATAVGDALLGDAARCAAPCTSRARRYQRGPSRGAGSGSAPPGRPGSTGCSPVEPEVGRAKFWGRTSCIRCRTGAM